MPRHALTQQKATMTIWTFYRGWLRRTSMEPPLEERKIDRIAQWVVAGLVNHRRRQ